MKEKAIEKSVKGSQTGTSEVSVHDAKDEEEIVCERES